MVARKRNRVIDVNEQTKKFYIERGYDIYEGGKLVERAKGATVPAAALDEANAENAKLKAEIEKTKAKKPSKE